MLRPLLFRSAVARSMRIRPFSSSLSLQIPFSEPAGSNPAHKYTDIQHSLHQYGSYLLACLPAHIEQYSVYKDELCLYVSPNDLVPTMRFLRDHSQCQYKQIVDITAVDFPTKDKRFEVVYNLLSHSHQSRIRVKTYADEVSPVPSLVGLYPGADWYEREVYDMYGVYFKDHPDLRRILTDYGFEGHPLRKDFPLTGMTEVRYDEEKKRVVSEPLQLSQAFRNFEGAASPWEQVGPGQDSRPESFKLKPPPTPEQSTEKK